MARKTSFVLASGSPRRLALLQQIGFMPDTVDPPEIDETPLPGEHPGRLAARLAEAKARTTAERRRNAVVMGADTVVARGRRVLPKPRDAAADRVCLERLSGRRHVVYGGVCVINAAAKAHTRLVATTVAFKRLSKLEIDSYIESGEWTDKAGGYAIQGRAAAFVQSINGSYSNVVGLPLYETANLLMGLGIRATP